MLIKTSLALIFLLFTGTIAAAIQKVPTIRKEIKPIAAKQRDVVAAKAAAVKAIASDYLITLERSVTMVQKDKILDVLMDKNGIVREIYDYKVYQGILFSFSSATGSSTDDSVATLAFWKSALSGLEGVKAVESDSVVKTN